MYARSEAICTHSPRSGTKDLKHWRCREAAHRAERMSTGVSGRTFFGVVGCQHAPFLDRERGGPRLASVHQSARLSFLGESWPIDGAFSCGWPINELVPRNLPALGLLSFILAILITTLGLAPFLFFFPGTLWRLHVARQGSCTLPEACRSSCSIPKNAQRHGFAGFRKAGLPL